jgi:hypothetical protein
VRHHVPSGYVEEDELEEDGSGYGSAEQEYRDEVDGHYYEDYSDTYSDGESEHLCGEDVHSVP